MPRVRSAYPRSHTAPDAIALRSFAPIFEETYRPGRHRVVTAAEGVRDPEHAGAFAVFVARPRNLWYRDFRSVVDARRALSVAGRAKDTICSLEFHALHLLHGGSLGTSGEMPAWQGKVFADSGSSVACVDFGSSSNESVLPKEPLR